MATGKVNSKLYQRLGELQKQHGGTIKVEDIARIVESLEASLRDDLVETNIKLFSELESLSSYIQTAKAEIVALRPDEIKDDYLPAATDELDAIIDATAVATNTIMDAAESIEGVLESVGEDTNKVLMEATTKIYEACGFQDITGQRVNKVVKALKSIEAKVDALMHAVGNEIEKVKAPASKAEKKDKPLSDEDLLNGPQSAEKTITQEEIDALLASFD